MTDAQAVENWGRDAKQAAALLATTSTEVKDRFLAELAALLRSETETVLAANARDLEAGGQANLSAALLDRLTLTEGRLGDLAGLMNWFRMAIKKPRVVILRASQNV